MATPLLVLESNEVSLDSQSSAVPLVRHRFIPTNPAFMTLECTLVNTEDGNILYIGLFRTKSHLKTTPVQNSVGQTPSSKQSLILAISETVFSARLLASCSRDDVA